jgi:hypothetical protein
VKRIWGENTKRGAFWENSLMLGNLASFLIIKISFLV